jgi:hypothetical protein
MAGAMRKSGPPRGFGSPDDYSESRPPVHDVDCCAWCGDCLHCEGDVTCLRGTDGMHYWPPRPDVGWL